VPNITASAPPDWNSLPQPAAANVAKYLNFGELVALSEVSSHWSQAITAKAFDDAARIVILEREQGGSTPWPSFCPSKFSAMDPADVASIQRFPHSGVLINLQRALGNLSTLRLDAATSSCAPFLAAPLPPVLSSSSAEPEFVAFRPDGSQNLSFVQTNGEARSPQSLMGQGLVSRCASLMPFQAVNSMLCRGTENYLLVRDRQSGALSIYNPLSDQLTRLPLDSMTQDDLGALSDTGRFVAALFRGENRADSRLVVLDRDNETVLTDTLLPGSNQIHLSVDSSGVAVIGDSRAGMEIAPGGQRTSVVNLTRPNSPYVLSPDGMNVIREGESRTDILLEGRNGGPSLTLKHPTWNEHSTQRVLPTSIAMSPGKVMAAVAYSDNTVAVFDLTSDEATISAKLHFEIPDAERPGDAATSFQRDGTELSVAYSRRPPSLGAPSLGFLTLSLI
jgi:hypothetical protein